MRKGADYRFATCLEHGKASAFLSVFSPKTVEAYDRVFAQLKVALRSQIDALRIGSPSDYGETHYPGGAGSQFFPVAHTHMGWWAGEPEAKQLVPDVVARAMNSSDLVQLVAGSLVGQSVSGVSEDPVAHSLADVEDSLLLRNPRVNEQVHVVTELFLDIG